jgi:uncharacterized protein (DUF2147 family)
VIVLRKLCLPVMLFCCLGGAALAAEPTGEWLVRDGTARIRIEPCADALWGIIAWTQRPGGTDSSNPDPAKRSRPIIGVPILRGMKQVGANKWEGEVYDARSGKIYSSNMTLVGDNVLRVEGCVLGGVFCDGENWTRAQPTDHTASTSRQPERQAAPARPAGRPAPAPAPGRTVCYDG